MFYFFPTREKEHTMCFERILQNLFSSVIYKKALANLCLFVVTALQIKKISVTSLGRGLNLPILEKSCVRRADRFIGNQKIYELRGAIYSEHIKYIIAQKVRPIILIDWSQVPNTKNHILTAALAGKGRAIIIYQQVHNEKKLNNPRIEFNFLYKLKSFLSKDCKPIIVSDAGFRVPFYKKILTLGWDFVGRVRGTPQCFDGEKWLKCKDLIANAQYGFRYVGKQYLCKTNTLETHLYLIKQKSKYRKSTRRKPGGKRDELNYKRAGKEAWLLATSLSGSYFLRTKRVVKIYKKRMQIEQNFRDIKNANHGFGLRNAYSRDLKRIQILLIIAMLATWIAWVVGYILEGKRIHLQFQVNSLKRRVLSLVYLGCRAIERGISITYDEFDNAISSLQLEV